MVVPCPCHALAVPSVGAHHCYAIQSVNPALSHLPFTLFQLPSPKKGSSAKNTRVGRDLLRQDCGSGLLPCPDRAAWCSQGVSAGGCGSSDPMEPLFNLSYSIMELESN